MKEPSPFFHPLPLVIGNWKMYKTCGEACSFAKELKKTLDTVPCFVGIAAPYTALYPLYEELKDTPFHVGAQNMFSVKEGAFTGEISASMLVDAKASFVLLGHSERRVYFKESNEEIQKKYTLALENSLHPILCIGETLEEKQDGKTFAVLESQLEILKDLVTDSFCPVIAYEPVWSIGTGLIPEEKEIHQTFTHIKEFLSSFGIERVALLYGGSVNKSNIKTLQKESLIGGFLVGGASLDAKKFAELISLASNTLPEPVL